MGGGFEVVALDLARPEECESLRDGLLRRGDPFDVIIANAGVMATPFGQPEDGFERKSAPTTSATSCS